MLIRQNKIYDENKSRSEYSEHLIMYLTKEVNKKLVAVQKTCENLPSIVQLSESVYFQRPLRVHSLGRW